MGERGRERGREGKREREGEGGRERETSARSLAECRKTAACRAESKTQSMRMHNCKHAELTLAKAGSHDACALARD